MSSSHPALTPLILFVLWTLALLLGIVLWRAVLVVRGDVRINAFPSGSEHGSSRYWRLNRAHMNAVENLPAFAALTLGGMLVSVQAPWFVPLAWVVVGARLLQSIVHIAGNAPINIHVRFSALLVQIGAFIGMAIALLS